MKRNSLAKRPKICVVGAGKVGSALTIALNDKLYQVNCLIDRNKRKLRDLSKVISKYQYSSITSEIIEKHDIFFIAVQDKNIAGIVKEIENSGKGIGDKIFIHLSGALSSDILKVKGIRKTNIASFHPIQTFNDISRSDNGYLTGIYFGIEGGSNAKTFLKKVVKSFGSDYIEVNPRQKYLYHAGSVIASNFLVAYMDAVETIIRKAGIRNKNAYKIYSAIITQTLDNIDKKGVRKSLTGPVERNDTEVLERQIKAIRKNTPELTGFYLEMSRLTAGVALKKGSLNRKQYRNLINIIDGRTPTS